MGLKVIIWFSALSSASRKHLITFCRPFVYYAFLKFVFYDQGRPSADATDAAALGPAPLGPRAMGFG